MSQSEHGVPFVIRIAGLPAAVMERFTSDLCAVYLEPMVELETRLKSARAALADALYNALTHADPELRRLMLNVKRDCFNGRPLGRRQRSALWPALCEHVGPVAEKVVAMELARAELADAFAVAWQRAREREVAALQELGEHRGLARGLALASPVLMDNLHRLGGGSDGKKAADLEASLLRYVSRAALKTSPFSTFTRIGLATAVAVTGAAWIRLPPGELVDRSLLRFKRYIPEQDCTALIRYPRIRDHLRVAHNRALWETAPDQYCFVRPSFWAAENGRMKYNLPALVQLQLGGPLVAWLRRELADSRWTHANLVAELSQVFEQDRARISQTIRQLLDVGFLRLLLPWPGDEGHLERRMLDYLRTVSAHDSDAAASADTAGDNGDGGDLASVIGHLDRIVELQQGYARTAAPAASIRSLERGMNDLWQSVRALGQLDREVERFRFPAGNLYEDVFVTAASDSPWQDVARISRSAVDAMARSSAPLAQLAGLMSPRYEFLHTVAAFAARRWPGRRDVGAIELVRDTRELWRGYNTFLIARGTRPAAEQRAMVFNPLNLDALHALRDLRDQVWAQLTGAVEHTDEDSRLAPEAITAALAPVPAKYRSALGACLMVQAADASGQDWVVNQLVEGTGRYSSRYTPAMPADVRQRYTDYLAARGVFEHRGARVELLDLMFNFNDTLNIHSCQTPRVLEMPDEWLELPGDRTLGLADLRVHFDDGELPRIVDTAGREYAPVHLGVADESFRPLVLRLLSQFGPGQISGVNLPRRVRHDGEIRIWPRFRVGNLIMHRQRWGIPMSSVPRAITRARGPEVFAEVNRWRLACGIPDRVFFIERMRGNVRGDYYKPQYIDFTSPGFVALLAKSLSKAKKGEILRLDEMLPVSEIAPADHHGRRWVVELQLDTLALRSPG